MELTEEEMYSYFIQENAITDMKNSSMMTLEEVFCEWLMTYIIWPPRTPDSNLWNQYLHGGTNRQIVYEQSNSLQQLDNNIPI